MLAPPVLAQMDPLKMTDTGMWIWAGILFAASLVLSYFVAVAWQKWRAQREEP